MPITNDYDVIIIGGGPAGSTVSTLLAQGGMRALLLEKSKFPREKVCGEFLTPACLDVSDRLGVSERIFEAGAKIIDKFKLFAPDGRSFDVPMEWMAGGHKNAIGISRARLDLILLDRAKELGVECRESFHVSPKLFNEKESFFIEGKSDGETIERFSTPLVIDASGRNGVFSNQTDRRASLFEGARLFGCKVHLRSSEAMNGTGELFFYRDGYGGICDVEDEQLNLSFITTETTLREARGDREKLLDLTMRLNPAAKGRLQNAAICGEWVGTGPIIYGRRNPIPGVISIGDSGAFIDPFTGSGILLAMTSAELAAEEILKAFSDGIRNAAAIADSYDRAHRARFLWRLRACSMLRAAVFNSTTRNALISLLARHQPLARLMALSARPARSRTKF